jgi:hypothetical protein
VESHLKIIRQWYIKEKIYPWMPQFRLHMGSRYRMRQEESLWGQMANTPRTRIEKRRNLRIILNTLLKWQRTNKEYFSEGM